jgi:dTDP-glucose 4,6-dehydratase
MKDLLITGGAGFIGSHVVKRFVKAYSDYRIVNLDALTYAGNLENLTDVESASNYVFEKGDITDKLFLDNLFKKYDFQGIIHLAAESHVDRSISDPLAFIQTNIIGTYNLLQAVRENCNLDTFRFYHVSTDEVYGSLGETGFFHETTAYDPKSPYSASKASSDHFVRAFGNTYGIKYVISNCSNNYGSHQFPEKLIPLCINNIKNNKPLPIYGKGENIRDWLFVEDHASAIDTIYHDGRIGETYNIGGENEWTNIDLVKLLIKVMDEKLDRPEGESLKLIEFVTDRAGHDLRYAIECEKLKTGLNWKPSLQFEEGLRKTVDWYLENETWSNRILSGEYQQYYEKQYETR